MGVRGGFVDVGGGCVVYLLCLYSYENLPGVTARQLMLARRYLGRSLGGVSRGGVGVGWVEFVEFVEW